MWEWLCQPINDHSRDGPLVNKNGAWPWTWSKNTLFFPLKPLELGLLLQHILAHPDLYTEEDGWKDGRNIIEPLLDLCPGFSQLWSSSNVK